MPWGCADFMGLPHEAADVKRAGSGGSFKTSGIQNLSNASFLRGEAFDPQLKDGLATHDNGSEPGVSFPISPKFPLFVTIEKAPALPVLRSRNKADLGEVAAGTTMQLTQL